MTELTAKSDVAIKAGREFLRKETGFIHYHYHSLAKENHSTIPMYENFAWALALFETRTQEAVLEGKETLTRLLAFQNEQGEFPVYLHEFPKASDPFLGAYLFYPLYWIWRDFAVVLGQDLKDKCANALKKMTQALKDKYVEKRPDGHIRVKVAGVLFAMEGDCSLVESPEHPFSNLTVSSTHIADLEMAREIGVPNLPVWPEVFWHSQFQCYTGPAFKERQEGLEPEITLLDLMMGAKRQSNLTPHHVCASLIRSSPIPKQESVRGVKQEKDFAYALLEKEDDSYICHQPGFHLLRFLTKGKNRIDSLAFQGSKLAKATFSEKENEVVFVVDFVPEFDPECRDKQREVELFINLGPKIKGSVFGLDQPVAIQFEKCKLSVTFRLIQGIGDFVGQISRGNRPSQIIKGEVFDQILSLRTLRRSPDARMEIKFKIDKML